MGKQTWAIIFKNSVPDPDPGTIFSQSPKKLEEKVKIFDKNL